MLNIFKRADKSQQSVGGGKGSDFEPPKNLPDLAGDIYENGYKKSIVENSGAQNNSPQLSVQPSVQRTPMLSTPVVTSSMSSTSIPIPVKTETKMQTQTVPQSFSDRPVLEPAKDAVPRFDMSLLRQQQLRPQDYVQGSPDSYAQTHSSIYSMQSPQQSVSQPIQNPLSYNASVHNDILGNNFNAIDDSTGFFKEFENYVRDNGLNNAVIDELLDKNLLDHMVFYHTAKGGDLPFYASSAELSHAIKLKLENLQSIERTWIMNRQKLDILKKLGINMETDIHLMSEELKKMMSESRKRGIGVKSSDFFQMIGGKAIDGKAPVGNINMTVHSIDSIDARGVSSSASNVISSTVPSASPVTSFASPIVSASSVPTFSEDRHDFKNVETVHPSPVSPLGLSVLSHSTNSKFVLSKYAVADVTKYFYADNGQVFKSLSDLMDGLESMDSNTFEHHVNAGKNDFSNWIKGVLGDLRLADAVRPLDSREKLWYYLRNNTL